MTYDPYKNRRSLKLHLIIELMQPMSHISETTGNEAALNVIPVTDLEGNTSVNPIYSANAQRNGNMGRRSMIASFFDALEIAVNQPTHQTFYSGGYIDGSTGNDLDWEAKARQLPALSVLGAAVPKGVMEAKNSQMMAGRMAIGDAYLICYESIRYIYEQCPPFVPEDCLEGVAAIVTATCQFQEARFKAWMATQAQKSAALQEMTAARAALTEARQHWIPYLQEQLRSATEWMAYKQKVRVPSTKQSELRRHLTPSPNAKISGDVEDKKKGKDAARQMISGSWVLQPGAQLYSFWCAQGQGITILEEGALVDALLKFSENPYIGGQSGSGCGLVKLDFWYQSGEESGKWLTIAPGNVQQLSSRAEECHQQYRSVLEQYRDHIAEIKAGNSDDVQQLYQMLLGNKP